MNRIIPASAVSVLLFTVLSGAGLANDSSANQTSSGLVFTRTDAVAMRSEELRISQKRIEVRYEFQNVTDKDVTLTVAFPLPDLESAYYNSDSDRDIMGEEFETTVDGTPVVLRAERKVLVDGKDVTARFEALGLPVDPDKLSEALDGLPLGERREKLDKLQADNLMPGDESRTKWTYRRRFYRKQTFPAGKTVVVTHRYTPSVGMSPSLPFDRAGKETGEKKYCIDRDIARSVLRAEQNGSIYFSRYINYILATGANWAGGRIDRFRLIVDKEKPENFIAFCGSGIRKIGPTRFEMIETDFTPNGNLDIAIFEYAGKQKE